MINIPLPSDLQRILQGQNFIVDASQQIGSENRGGTIYHAFHQAGEKVNLESLWLVIPVSENTPYRVIITSGEGKMIGNKRYVLMTFLDSFNSVFLVFFCFFNRALDRASGIPVSPPEMKRR